MSEPELTTKQLSDLFRRSEIGQQMIAQSRAETIAARQTAADAIAVIEKKREADFDKAHAAYRKRDAEYQAALHSLHLAEAARREAFYDRHNVEHRAEVAKRPHEKILRDTADPAIHALAVLVSRAEALPCTMADLQTAESTARVTKRKQSQREVIRETDSLWQEPLTNQQLTARLEVLRRRAFPDPAFATSHN